ncbi:MAG: ATP-binding protein [Sulfitobacter sp.]|nr:ATP-binding protein [Sulfitobacter sp.]
MAQSPLFTDAISALPLPTLGINRAERIFAMTGEAEPLLGPGMMGRHFVTALRQPALVEAVEKTMATGKPGRVMYLAGGGESDTTFEVNLRAVPPNGDLVLTFQDVTHMAEAVQMRRDFVANVSHELRTPLTALLGFIETLRGPARNDEAARDRFLAIMADEAGRMNRLVDDLLSLNRVESDERVRPRERIDLTAVLQAAVRNLNPLAVDNDVSINPTFDRDPVMLLGDRDQLLQVFTNLIENAIKYGGAGKEITLSLEVTPRDGALRSPGVRVTVADQGPGIDPLHLPRLTERFYRADSHRSRALGGTGLGLAIVKHILNRHRGRLRINSVLGQGAAFTVILPTAAPEAKDEDEVSS